MATEMNPADRVTHLIAGDDVYEPLKKVLCEDWREGDQMSIEEPYVTCPVCLELMEKRLQR